MTNATASVCTTIVDRLDEAPELRPFPAAAARLIAACQDPESSSKDLVDIMGCDPALAGRLLRLANSSMYGCSGRIHTAAHAIVVLGFRTVKNLALSMAGAGMFAQGDGSESDRMALWEHSLGCATVARLLSDHVAEVVSDEAFLAGIFHDMGLLTFYDMVPDEYRELQDRMLSGLCGTAAEVLENERTTFGITHPDVGQHLGEAWGLTDEINLVSGYHHAPDDTPEYFELVAIAHAADSLSKAWGIGYDGPWDDIGSAQSILKELNVNVAAVDQVREAAPEAFEEVRRAFCS